MAGIALRLLRALTNPAKFLDTLRHSDLVDGPLTYNQDGLATRHNADFMQDPLFAEAYQLGQLTYVGSRLEHVQIHWRVHVACWAAYHGKKLEGDFVECGVYRGWLSRAVTSYVDFKNLDKKFYLLDTYRGPDERYVLETERHLNKRTKYETDYYENIKTTFKEFSNVVIIRGPVPETLPQVQAEKICYLSLDMNSVTPEIAAAEFFWAKMVPGAMIILDDYGWSGHHLQKQAFDKFAVERDVKVLSLPTGQGLIIKP